MIDLQFSDAFNLKTYNWCFDIQTYVRVFAKQWPHSTYEKPLRLEKLADVFNPSNAEATIVQSTRTLKSLKTIETLSCWYSFESSR